MKKYFIAIATNTWLVFVVAIATQPQLNALADWPQFGGPRRNFQVPALAASDKAVIQPWQVRLDGGDDCPVVVGDRVIVSQIDFASDGTDAHRLTCLRLQTGEVLWQRTLNEKSYISQDINDRYPVRPVATACIANGCVVAVGFGGSVNCLSLSDGSVQWSKDLVADFGATPIQYGFATSPWSDGERVVVACGGTGPLLIAFRLKDGQVEWRSGAGPASYASLVDFDIKELGSTKTTHHLIYAAGDELLSVDPKTGSVLWTYPYPKKGLTNAVTPVVINNSQLLVGGQGIGGSSLLQIDVNADGTYSPKEVWRNSKITPFYCNWVVGPSKDFVVGFEGKALYAMDWRTGKVVWQQRGWTDANLVSVGDDLIAVRGDGAVARAQVDDKGIKTMAASSVARDRIWAPPTIVGRRVLLRGRTSLSCIDIESLKPGAELPSGTAVTSMDAMYGNPTEKIAELQQKAQDSSSKFTFEDYLQVAADRSVQMVDSDYERVVTALTKTGPSKLALQIAEDWGKREPNSIVAFKYIVSLMRDLNDIEGAIKLEQTRKVKIQFEVTVPESTPEGASVYLTSNATSLGKWQPDSVQLTRTAAGTYSVAIDIPRGDLQYKFTCGTWDTSEVRADGRSTANRRLRVTEDTSVQATVQAWKSK